MSKSIILVAVDRSPASTFALEAARAMAERDGSEAHAVCVIAPVETPSMLEPYVVGPASPALGQPLAEAQAWLVDACRARPPAVEMKPHVRVGAPAKEIVALAEELGADLVLVGTHGRTGIRRALLGSVAETVVRTAPCAVLVVRPKENSDVPAIEPPCVDCVAARQASGDAAVWCARHTRHHPHAHTYSDRPSSPGFTGPSFGTGGSG